MISFELQSPPYQQVMKEFPSFSVPFSVQSSAREKISLPSHSRYCHCHLPLYFTDAERTGKPFKSASSFFRFFRRRRSKILINAGWEREKKIDILHVLPRDQNWKRSIAHPAIVFEKKEEKKNDYLFRKGFCSLVVSSALSHIGILWRIMIIIWQYKHPHNSNRELLLSLRNVQTYSRVSKFILKFVLVFIIIITILIYGHDNNIRNRRLYHCLFI